MIYEHILDKRQLRQAFERAAASYDQAAVLQREVCERMLSRLDYIKHTPGWILDMGSGTGYGSRKLIERYPRSKLVAVDIALAMHLQARPSLPRWQQWLPLAKRSITHYVGADIEQLPLRNACMDMIWSNLTIQWCNDLKQTFAETHRVLKSGGLLMFSTFGPDTLKELKQAFKTVDSYSHINRFMDMHDIGDLLVYNGFATPVMDMEYITLTYHEVMDIMRDLKAIGAHNVTYGRQRGLTGKGRWQQVMKHYESLRQAGRLPATFEVVYGHAWKPEPRQNVLKPETRQKLGLE
ncbi:malonyl-ACP O-methyltransferase BioC [Nitrosomonas sp. Is37]|uniref:malonyl-ACP O-methyltransferase BioC n=1 Tax=Nitrosomonas sp. Is37 TaxID=3080535 RepID=UPI00294B5F3F|nr:malonyl-ACP O-methyltransferase BioC [Nitrosomonas sp. Is37]MDV6344451.1 malonyl-ACP O-methyltransferase BioC [Nitrosomonas sp. Is37]